MSSLTVYCESFGCQMNAYDSEIITSLLEYRGHRIVESPADADVIIVNTCSVRAHAEERAIGRLHDLSRHAGAALVVCGCMAQRLGTALFDKLPGLRGVAGPESYDRLPAAIEEASSSGARFALLEASGTTTYALPKDAAGGGVSRYLAITMGCDNYCSYCIVPFLRGPVRSKAPETIAAEAAALCERGAREITLLGQNVIAYHHGETDFVSLVERILAESPVARLRFMTSHPKDTTARIFELMARERRVCPHLHLPIQSGSDRILGLMNRTYTRERYQEIVRDARAIVPDLALTSDVIVGFPTETEHDFQETLDAVEMARFDAAFTFKYSPREGTVAAKLDDDVTPEVKRERLRVLNDVVTSVRADILASQLGTRTEILLDGEVQKGEHRFRNGRTPHFRNVIVAGGDLKDGDIAPVTLKRLVNFTFEGDVAISQNLSQNL
jgi:tRNA-2-methylthio-N6-dimethylallyladenosine synthase